jgi:SAM-dependent methyltransferase
MRALGDQRGFYDARYRAGYMEGFSDLYEACRVHTVEWALARLAERRQPHAVLDYGCGGGRYIDVLTGRFPAAQVVGSDISSVALQLARERNPDADYVLMRNERVDLPASSFDLILTVEVLEHVADVRAATRELGRLLAPGGVLVATTPCANAGSPEWLWNVARRGIQRSPDGYRRFATDEPGHLRRLTSTELARLLDDAGARVQRSYYRGQLFTPLAMLPLARRLPLRHRVSLGLLDWRFARWAPNGSTMLVIATSTKI